MNENWMTTTVCAICNGMRQSDDYSSMPILADALEDAGCDDAALLGRLRGGLSKLMAQTEVCLILGGKLAESVNWLMKFTSEADCPGYEDTVSAAIGINIREGEREDDWDMGDGRMYDMSGYYDAGLRDWGELCLHFGGRDAHGDIPAEFWDHVAVVTAKEIPQEGRASSFSCSC